MHVEQKFSQEFINGFLVTFSTIFTSYLWGVSFRTWRGVFGIPRNGIFFHKLISSSDTLTKREAAILKICPLRYKSPLRRWLQRNMTPFSANESARISIITWVIILKRYINRFRQVYSNIFEAWLLSSPPLPSRQVNMADSFGWIFRLFGRHHCKSRIFERMENFPKWLLSPLDQKNLLRTRVQGRLRIVNVVVSWSPADQIDWPKAVFLQYEVTLFETMMTTINEVNRDINKGAGLIVFP